MQPIPTADELLLSVAKLLSCSRYWRLALIGIRQTRLVSRRCTWRLRMGTLPSSRYCSSFLAHSLNAANKSCMRDTLLRSQILLGQVLLEASADKNAADLGGRTPLHLAAMYGCMAALEVLLVSFVLLPHNENGQYWLLALSIWGNDELRSCR